MTKFSIITVTLNNLLNLKLTLDSIFEQTFKDYEIIIIDGGSTEGTVEYLEKIDQINFKFISENDKGIYDAQNKGIKLARGEYLFFLNGGDTFCNKDVLNNISTFINKEDLIFYGDIIIKENKFRSYERKYPEKLTYKYWYDDKFLCHQATIFKSEVFKKYGVYDTTFKFASDYDLIQKVWVHDRAKFRHIPVFIVNYDLNGISAQKDNEKKVLNEYKFIQRKYHFFMVHIIFSFIYNILVPNKKYTIIKIFLDIIFKTLFVLKTIKRIFQEDDSKNSFSLSNTASNKIKILHFSTLEKGGGASGAANRIYKSLKLNSLDSKMVVMHKISNDPEIILGNKRSGLKWFLSLIKSKFKYRYYKNYTQKTKVLHSLQLFSSIDIKKILDLYKPDILHLHWICGNFISIEDLTYINVPIVWTLHDMWSFVGAEHVNFDDSFIDGYDEKKDPINYYTFQRKKEAYKNLKIYPVGVSDWITQKSKSSPLFSNYRFTTIPNIVSTEDFFCEDKRISRSYYGFNQEDIYILFGSDYIDENKGYKYIEDIMTKMEEEKRSNVHFVFFGTIDYKLKFNYIKVNFMGYINNIESLRKLYSSVDLLVVPSKIESFCLVAAESIACGTPVISFDTSGLRNIVIDGVTGYKVKEFSSEKIYDKINQIIEEKKQSKFKSKDLEDFVRKNFNSEIVSNKYENLYKSIIKDSNV